MMKKRRSDKNNYRYGSFAAAMTVRLIVAITLAASIFIFISTLQVRGGASSPISLKSWSAEKWASSEPHRRTALSFLSSFSGLLSGTYARKISRRLYSYFGRGDLMGASGGPAYGGPAPRTESRVSETASNLVQNLLVEVTGDKSRRRRMGQACQQRLGSLTKTNIDERHDADSVELVKSSSQSWQDPDRLLGERKNVYQSNTFEVEVQAAGALISKHDIESQTPGVVTDIGEDVEPYEGMMLQVLPLDWVEEISKGGVETFDSNYQIARSSSDSEGTYASTQDSAGEPLPCVSSSHIGTISDEVIQYELLERIKMQLGLVDNHYLDFMYRPVLQTPDEEEENRGYEWTEDHAFAGGSHGEVWRARRKCPSQSESGGLRPPCNEGKKLIMKRLKVEHGYDLMEAGLREVYFGELLARDLQASDLFTKYEDHFFREIPIARAGRSSPKKRVELWIVFEHAGPSLRSYLYSPMSSGDFLLYQHSSFWRRMRMGVASDGSGGTSSAVSLLSETKKQTSKKGWFNKRPEKEKSGEGRTLIQKVLKDILTAADHLHRHGIVHRDIKPSNVMCNVDRGSSYKQMRREINDVHCVLGDFSSAVDSFTSANLYSNGGPSAAEQTTEYAPPESLFGSATSDLDFDRPQSYDSWSIGVVALEMLLGTPNVFSVDQRTTALLTHRMQKQGASEEEIRRALYLAALSNFCIFIPDGEKSRWPLRVGDPLEEVKMVKKTCNLQDFHSALRARDPLGIGFDSSSDSLLLLVWGLLAWAPANRLTASEALSQPYFNLSSNHETFNSAENIRSEDNHALETRIPNARVDTNATSFDIDEFVCPKCGKKFEDHNSCQQHARSRRHATFCSFSGDKLPPCLNAHAMLPSHPTSGYCDIQGRRATIEDFHTVHLDKNHQFFGVFDGHNGNLASKYAASFFYSQLVERLSDLDEDIVHDSNWKVELEEEMEGAFKDLHEDILDAVSRSPEGVMKLAGTTATVLFITAKAVVVANVGDSRAILSKGMSQPIELTMDHVASNREERTRIENLGGFVSSVGGTDRVNGTLAVTRSLGDAHLASLLSRSPHVFAMTKTEIRGHCEEGGKSDEEEMQSQDSPLCFIVLASDGLWDVMTNEDVSNMVLQVMEKYDPKRATISLEEGGAFQEAAKRLTQEAYVRGSSDNIGVAVVDIHGY